jgi:chromosomal replication initiation ATPase DnaA
MPDKNLFNLLVDRATAPSYGFDRFVVGTQIREHRQSTLDLITKIADHTAPSQVLVVTGQNGNGKTLLNNWIKQDLSDRNQTRSSAEEFSTQDKFVASSLFGVGAVTGR